MTSIAVIGAGNMGANHGRVVATSARAEMRVVIDTDAERATALAATLGTRSSTDVREAFACDAAIVAGPTEAHLDLALPLLEAGIPCLVEKPLADDLTAVRTLVDAAAEERVALMCGFVERFNPAILATHDLLDAEPYHLLAVRHSPHNPRTRSSVIDDLLIHDIDLVLGLARGAVTSIGGSRWVSDDGVEEVVDCTLHFDGGAVATLSSSRASQRKVRSISISTAEQLFEVDLLRHDLTTYRHRSAEVIDRGGPSYRAETVVEIPFVRHAGEPLALQFDHFVDLIEGAADPEMERATLLGPHEVVDTIKERVRSST